MMTPGAEAGLVSDINMWLLGVFPFATRIVEQVVNYPGFWKFQVMAVTESNRPCASVSSQEMAISLRDLDYPKT